MYAAASKDGKEWTRDGRLLFSQASVPGAVHRDGVIYLYFVDGSEWTPHGLSVAVSGDGGETYTKKPVEIEGHTSAVADPHPVVLDDGRIRLYYLTSYPSPPGYRVQVGEITAYNAMAAAVSEDGVDFTVEAERAFVHPRTTDPDVFRTGAGWMMLASTGPTLVRATSEDGLAFTYQENLDLGGSVSSTAAVGGRLTTFYCTNGGIAASVTDGAEWRPGELALRGESPSEFLCDPSVIQLDDGTYRMYYKRANAPEGARPPRGNGPGGPGATEAPGAPGGPGTQGAPGAPFAPGGGRFGAPSFGNTG